jgi:hypothetical protein
MTHFLYVYRILIKFVSRFLGTDGTILLFRSDSISKRLDAAF